MTTRELNPSEIEKNIIIDARAVGIPEGAAEIFAERTVKSAIKSLDKKSIITESDLNRAIHKELKKYNDDLAYVYENRDKIV